VDYERYEECSVAGEGALESVYVGAVHFRFWSVGYGFMGASSGWVCGSLGSWVGWHIGGVILGTAYAVERLVEFESHF